MSMNKFVMSAGLPRSGSTLMMNILAQNPNIAVTPTSGLIDLVAHVRDVSEQNPVIKALPEEVRQLKRYNMVKGLVEGYFTDYADGKNKPRRKGSKATAAQVYVDKNRGWPRFPMYEFMNGMHKELCGGEVKVLVCVRDVREVLASWERMSRRTAEKKKPPLPAGKPLLAASILGRVQFLMSPSSAVGYSINMISEMVDRGLGDNMLFIDYNHLTSDPEAVFKSIYEHIEEPNYKHNFNKVNQVTVENDEVHGFIDLHDIKSKVAPKKDTWPTVFSKEIRGAPYWKEHIVPLARFWENWL